MSGKYFLIDSYGFIFRAYHVMPGLTSPSGEPVGAILGFTSMLMKVIQDHKPYAIAAVFDSGGKNFRHEIYPSYKSHRPEISDELKFQLPLSRKVADALNIKTYELGGFEADDIIATLAKLLKSQGKKVVVVSSDKDLMQLMDEDIEIYDPVKSKFLSIEDVEAKFGVREPAKIRDILALVGDKSDNIPSVNGFGPKTAAELINQFSSFDNLLANTHLINSERKRKLIESHITEAKLAYELVRLKSDIDLSASVQDLKWSPPDIAELMQFLNNYGFKSLLSRATKISNNGSSVITRNESDVEIEKYESSGSMSVGQIFNEGYVSILESNGAYLAASGNVGFKLANPSEIDDILADESILKIVPDIKKIAFDIHTFADLGIMAYVLTCGDNQQTLQENIAKYLGIRIDGPEQVLLNMKKLHDYYIKKLFEEKLLSIYYDIDLPISKILLQIEKVGVKFDVAKLENLSARFGAEISDLERKIFAISGQEFNVASPKQLGEVLFDKLALPYSAKQNKSGSYTTNSEILEDLSSQGFEIANLLLKWRQISKLKNTYTDALVKLVNPVTGRIHTTLQQTSTSTSRLSSHDPNLQNIPIRTKEGEEIRSAVIAEEGQKLISADYSQIELRILAEIANVRNLKQAFISGLDVHAKTASEIFGIAPEKVSIDERRKAKAINFGIIYGISSFGLAKQLNISKSEAKDYIEAYFQTYPEIKEYMDSTIEFAKNNGYVKNYFGRKLHIPAFQSGNFMLKSFAERAAINSPIQSAASDIAKIAMINMQKILQEYKFQAKMILQIHDELLFEAPENEIEALIPKIKKSMESAANFDSKLVVDITVSAAWN